MKILAWHFVRNSRELANQPGMVVEPCYIYSEDSPKLEICKVGLHGSRRCIDALSFAPGTYLCRVSMWGDVQEEKDKQVSRHRHVIAAADVSAELRLWACWCVPQQWELLTDGRSRQAVIVAERYARGEATVEELSAAAAYAASAYAASAACAAAAASAQKTQSIELERRMKAALRVKK